MYRSEGDNGGCLVAEEAGMSKTAIKCRNSSCHYLLGMPAATKHAHTDNMLHVPIDQTLQCTLCYSW